MERRDVCDSPPAKKNESRERRRAGGGPCRRGCQSLQGGGPIQTRAGLTCGEKVFPRNFAFAEDDPAGLTLEAGFGTPTQVENHFKQEVAVGMGDEGNADVLGKATEHRFHVVLDNCPIGAGSGRARRGDAELWGRGARLRG